MRRLNANDAAVLNAAAPGLGGLKNLCTHKQRNKGVADATALGDSEDLLQPPLPLEVRLLAKASAAKAQILKATDNVAYIHAHREGSTGFRPAVGGR
jgi:hypothetical protein